MDPLKQIKSMGLWLGLILIFIGLILLIFPQPIIRFLAAIVGAILLLSGIFNGVSALKNRTNTFILKGFVSVALIALGIYVLINTNVTITFTGIMIGIFAILSAVDRFSVAMERKKLGFPIGTTVVFGVVNLAFGVGMMVASIYVMSFLLVLAGMYLILAGIMIIISTKILMDY